MPVDRDSIKAGHTIANHANLQNAAKWLGCRMEQSPMELQRTLAIATQTNPSILSARQQTIVWLRAHSNPRWNTRFEEAREIEREINAFFKHSSKEKDSLENDALAQLSFQSEFCKPLNYIPFALATISLFKIWIVPAITILTPILAWILPYILLKFVYALPIQHEEYNAIFKTLLSGNLMRRSGITDPSTLWSGRSVTQMIIFAFSFLQSLIQPIQNAMHLHTTDKVFWELGHKLIRLREIAQLFRTELQEIQGVHIKISDVLDTLPENDCRAAFFLVKEQPDRVRIVLRDLARLEILWQIAQKDVLQPVEFDAQRFELQDVVDISLQTRKVPSSLQMQAGKQPHAVLTGPNGGGKSSFMRAVLQSVLFGHSYGVAPARSATMPFFRWIASGLQLRDTPGKLSMFETEVKFAADVLHTSHKEGPGLVLFDELFHSTNPPDGIRTAQLFMNGLWNRTDVFSIVSTHVYRLIETAPCVVQPICCTAVRPPGTNLIYYSYAVSPGICRISSVDKVWETFGLRSGSPGQTLSSEEKHAN